MKEMRINEITQETIDKIKTRMARSHGSDPDKTILVGISFHFLAQDFDVAMSNNLWMKGFDPEEYDL